MSEFCLARERCFSCTRLKGHKGEHVATWGGQTFYTWGWAIPYVETPLTEPGRYHFDGTGFTHCTGETCAECNKGTASETPQENGSHICYEPGCPCKQYRKGKWYCHGCEDWFDNP